MTDTTVEDEDLVRLAIGGRKVRRQRLSNLVLARLLGLKQGEQAEDETEDELGEEAEEGGDWERRLVRLMIGKGLVRRARLRRLLLAHLLRDKVGEEEEDEDEKDGGADVEHEDRHLVRLLIGRNVVRRRRLRRLLLAHLLQEKVGEEDEGGEDDGEDGEHEDRHLVRLLIGRNAARRTRLRRLLFAQLLRGRREESAEDVK
jgi:hypothetical protein